MTQEIVIKKSEHLSLSELVSQVSLVQEVMQNVMKDGEHYGIIPGCGKKPSLLKAGAEKLAFVFRLCPEFTIEEKSLEKNHREYRVVCTMKGRDGTFLGQGVGAATTLESKWKYRKDFKGNRVEHDNPADYFNTCLKMAKKRAQVDATLTCTAASDIFTQDIEELAEHTIEVKADVSTQKTEAPAPKKEFKKPDPIDCVNVDGNVIGVKEATGPKKDGSTWTRFDVEVDDGNDPNLIIGTFSKTDGDKAKTMIGKKVSVAFTETNNGKFTNRSLHSIELFDDIHF